MDLKYNKVLTLDFSRIQDYLDIDSRTILRLMGLFNLLPSDNIQGKYKEKLTNLILTENFQTKNQLSKSVSLSDSYVCRILKHHK